MANKPKNLKPFKKGYDPRRHIKQKGEISFKTAFYKAWEEVAEALRLNKKPDRAKIEIIKLGFKEMFKGNYQFWRDFVDRIFGKVEEKVDITSKGKPLSLLSNLKEKPIKSPQSKEE